MSWEPRRERDSKSVNEGGELGLMVCVCIRAENPECHSGSAA